MFSVRDEELSFTGNFKITICLPFMFYFSPSCRAERQPSKASVCMSLTLLMQFRVESGYNKDELENANAKIWRVECEVGELSLCFAKNAFFSLIKDNFVSPNIKHDPYHLQKLSKTTLFKEENFQAVLPLYLTSDNVVSRNSLFEKPWELNFWNQEYVSLLVSTRS